MADLEDVTLDGRPLQSLRVADLKAALDERGLSKSGQKNALIKRLKGALMLENLQRTSTAHVGLQPNSQIGEEMSQNSFIKQYLAKQQELLRQRLEREAREAYDTNDQEDHTEVNNSTSCPPQAQDAAPALAEQHKPPGPSCREGLFGAVNEGEGDRNQDADMSGPPASGSVAMRVPGGDHRPEKGSASNEAAADSDDDDSDDGEEDGDDDDWESGARRRREPARMPTTRERSGASCQPPQQHMPSLLSPQLRQPTPPPSPPPELSFPLPDTPKQSPPSPDVAPARRSSSTSSSGSSSSGSRSSSPEPQRSGHVERKPGPLTLLARKMESEGAFSGAGWHRDGGVGDRQDGGSLATSFPGRGAPEGLVSAITHTATTAAHVSFPMNPGTNQGITGAHSAHIQAPVSVLKATATEERDRERDAEIERQKALELERQERQRKLEQERAMEEERERALALEREERERVLEKERQQALEREEREKALQRERELALERERQERERALAKEREERERALELERQKELERQRALEQERLQREKEEREEIERAKELERAKALEQERMERERALEQERLQRERALEAERKEKERIEREKALEQERLERERLEREQERLELERQEREKAMEQERLERIEREKAMEQERLERERLEREKAMEQERLELERLEREKAMEQARLEMERALERERIEREKALEQERVERERIEREKALEEERIERERIEREKALEQERIERERIEQEKALEQERMEREKALEQERIERERIELEKALEQERIERERALEQERLEQERALEQQRLEHERKERIEKEKALEQERMEREKALEREREEKERVAREAALEEERKEKERAEKEKKERLEREKALEQEKLERERALEKEKAMQKEKEEQERTLEQEKERARMAEKERESHLPPSKRGREIGLTPLPAPPPLSTGPGRKASTEAGEQEDVRAPMSAGEAAESAAPMSPTPLLPQSSFKKFRFLRDSPIQLQSSSSSMGIKRPRTFSDTPQPLASPASPLSDAERQQEGLQSSIDQKDSQTQSQTKQEDVAMVPGSAAAQPEKEPAVGTALVPSPEKVIPVSEEADLVKSEQAAKKSTNKAKEVVEGPAVDSAQQRGRDTKKQEKQARRRSSSNDSSSSESDSGSSSSGSSSSSSSSEEKRSRGRREGKPERVSSPHHKVTPEAQAESLKEKSKSSPCKREMTVEKSDTAADGDSHRDAKKLLSEAPTREESHRKRKDNQGEEEADKQRLVKESAMAEPEKLPETSEETPKPFSARKISISSSKSSPGSGSAESEQDSGAAAGRKRRWGSSTAVTAKKPSISITTDSLKSLIPDIRPCLGQEAVVDLHPEEAVLSGAEDEERDRSDQDLQIRRTVTQVVYSESQENGQKEAKRSRHEELEEEDQQGDAERTGAQEEKMDTSLPGAMETTSPSNTSHDVEVNTVTTSDTLIRRSISQQKTGVSITIDDPIRTARQPSPPRGKVSNIVHVCNLVRPFTLGQLKELLGRTGTLVEEGFWIDKIKSHCYVTYCNPEEAAATRAALHGVKWPQSNPKVLSVDFCQQDELDFHKGLADRPGAEEQGPGRGRTLGLPSLFPERDQWAEREREMERREKARAEREWDRDKVKEFGKPGEEKDGGPRRSRSRERRRRERGKSKEKKTEKKEKVAEDPPAKLLDDLFRKTKAAPCIYWLPLTDEQFNQREAARAERMKVREKRRKELDEEEEKKKEEERKERMKAGGGPTGERSEGEKEKDRDRDRDRDRGRDRDRDRDRENDKRRDGYRRPEGRGTGGGRRSRSRSDPRERRR